MAAGNLIRSCWQPKPLEILTSEILSITKDMEITWEGFETEYKNCQSRIILSCLEHGKWSVTVNQFISKKNNCKYCAAALRNKPLNDQHYVDKFVSTNCFQENTKFIRLDVRAKNGARVFWEVECGKCLEKHISRTPNLEMGKVPCKCSGIEQRQAYILLISENCTDIAIKFGISSNYTRRFKEILKDSSSAIKLQVLEVFSFPDSASCKAAERECKEFLERSIIDRALLPNGFSETTWCYNLDYVKSIYRQWGGNPLEV